MLTAWIFVLKVSVAKAVKGEYRMDKCPKMEFQKDMLGGDYMSNATFTFRDDDGFYKDLSETWGIEKD